MKLKQSGFKSIADKMADPRFALQIEGPQIMFPYNIDEMRQKYNSCLYQLA